jgi:hypothetical protein
VLAFFEGALAFFADTLTIFGFTAVFLAAPVVFEVVFGFFFVVLAFTAVALVVFGFFFVFLAFTVATLDVVAALGLAATLGVAAALDVFVFLGVFFAATCGFLVFFEAVLTPAFTVVLLARFGLASTFFAGFLALSFIVAGFFAIKSCPPEKSNIQSR